MMLDHTPRAVLAQDDHGPYVVVTSYILMSIMVLCVVLKLRPSRRTLVQLPRPDELLLLIAMVSTEQTVAVIENVIIQEAVENGLGKRQEELSQDQLDTVAKTVYASHILTITVLCLSKLSVFAFIGLLTISQWAVKTNRLLSAMVLLWGIAMTFALAFQCRLPYPWQTLQNECLNQLALRIFINVFSVVTDLLTIILPTIIIWKVHIRKHQKGVVIAAFATRLVVCLASIIQTTTLDSTFSSNDYTYNSYTVFLWNQIIMNLSVITAAIPSLRPIFISLQSGLMDSTVHSSSELETSTLVTTWTRRMEQANSWKFSNDRNNSATL